VSNLDLTHLAELVRIEKRVTTDEVEKAAIFCRQTQGNAPEIDRLPHSSSGRPQCIANQTGKSSRTLWSDPGRLDVRTLGNRWWPRAQRQSTKDRGKIRPEDDAVREIRLSTRPRDIDDQLPPDRDSSRFGRHDQEWGNCVRLHGAENDQLVKARAPDTWRACSQIGKQKKRTNTV
jgi:hypothetical protein